MRILGAAEVLGLKRKTPRQISGRSSQPRKSIRKANWGSRGNLESSCMKAGLKPGLYKWAAGAKARSRGRPFGVEWACGDRFDGGSYETVHYFLAAPSLQPTESALQCCNVHSFIRGWLRHYLYLWIFQPWRTDQYQYGERGAGLCAAANQRSVGHGGCQVAEVRILHALRSRVTSLCNAARR